jgi:tetratricopeptide (TPR) repeat protein
MPYRALIQAIELSREGHVDEALEVLEALTEELPEEGNEDVDGLHYFLLRSKNRLEDAVGLATRRLSRELTDEACSLWSLRRGLLYLELENGRGAMVDLNTVLRLNANEHQTEQARQALLQVADLLRS